MPAIKTSREEIIQKSALLIWKEGFQDTSISKLAKACGVHNSHFYYYFAGKEDLMQAVLEYVRKLFQQKFFSVAYDEGLSTEQKIDKLTAKMQRFYRQADGGCMMANTALETAGKDYRFLEVVKAFFQDFIACLTHIYAEKYPPELARNYAEQAVQDVEGGILLMRIFNDRTYLDNSLARVKR